MQLGKRWQAGTPAPVLHPDAHVQQALEAEIALYEAQNPDVNSWTLTFLEGKPRIASSIGAILSLDNLLSPVWEKDVLDDDDDDWLS